MSEVVELGDSKGKLILLTLGISRVVEQQSLDVSIWASADGQEWGGKPLAAFPQKFYCGVYTMMLDLSGHPEAGYLQARWKMNRWGRGSTKPDFTFYLFAREAGEEAIARTEQPGTIAD